MDRPQSVSFPGPRESQDAAWDRRVRTRVQLAAISSFMEAEAAARWEPFADPGEARSGYRSLDLSSFARDGRNVVKSYPVFLGREFPSPSSGRTSPTLASSAAATASSTRSNQTNSS